MRARRRRCVGYVLFRFLRYEGVGLNLALAKIPPISDVFAHLALFVLKLFLPEATPIKESRRSVAGRVGSLSFMLGHRAGQFAG